MSGREGKGEDSQCVTKIGVIRSSEDGDANVCCSLLLVVKYPHTKFQSLFRLEM